MPSKSVIQNIWWDLPLMHFLHFHIFLYVYSFYSLTILPLWFEIVIQQTYSTNILFNVYFMIESGRDKTLSIGCRKLGGKDMSRFFLEEDAHLGMRPWKKLRYPWFSWNGRELNRQAVIYSWKIMYMLCQANFLWMTFSFQIFFKNALFNVLYAYMKIYIHLSM